MAIATRKWSTPSSGRKSSNSSKAGFKLPHNSMPETEKGEYYVGVDLGGTKIYAGVFDSSLNLLGTARVSTKAQRGHDAVIERIYRCVQDAVDECDLSLKQVRAIGVGAPGAVDPESGKVIFAPNLDWKDVPLKKE